MTNYFVSAAGNNNNTGLEETKAFATLQKGADVAKPGDTVYVLDGVYTSRFSSILNIANKQGTPEAPIKFLAKDGAKPILSCAGGNVWNAIVVYGSSYVTISGFTIQGSRDEITLEYALAEKDNMNNPKTSGNGIYITTFKASAPGSLLQRSHHITVSNCTVDKVPGGGIVASQSDYITLDGNTTSGCGYYSPHGNQGISIFEPWNYDTNTTDYKIVITNNRSFDNESKVPWKVAGKITEGHGLMLDTGYVGSEAYKGKFLIKGNVVYNNGGSALQLFKGICPVDVISNTFYRNCTALPKGELFIVNMKNVTVSKNIFSTVEGKLGILIEDSSAIKLDTNINHNGSSRINNVVVNDLKERDPLFVDEVSANFNLKPESVAKAYGALV
jgi:parallel beta-helix repeat protein